MKQILGLISIKAKIVILLSAIGAIVLISAASYFLGKHDGKAQCRAENAEAAISESIKSSQQLERVQHVSNTLPITDIDRGLDSLGILRNREDR